MERATTDEEYVANVRSKSAGQSDTSFRITMHPNIDVRTTILRHIPTKINIVGLTKHGKWPIVDKSSFNIAANLSTCMDPIPNSVAIVKELTSMIKEGLIERIPGVVQKYQDDNPSNRTYHRAYLYVQAGCEMPPHWRTPITGSLHDFSFIKNSTKRVLRSRRSESIVSRCLANLPSVPASDSMVDPIRTEGTTWNLLGKIGMEVSSRNARRLDGILHKYVEKGHIKSISKQDIRCRRGAPTTKIYYKPE